jgi:integrase
VPRRIARTVPTKPQRNSPVIVVPTGVPRRDVRGYKPTPGVPYWRATFYEPGVARQQATTFTTEEEMRDFCVAKAAELAGAAALGHHGKRPYRPIEALLAAYLDPNGNARQWRGRTLEKRQDLAHRFLDDDFRRIVCKTLHRDDLQGVLDRWAGQYSRSYMLDLRALLTGIVQFGIVDQWFLPSQFMHGVKLVIPRPDDEEELDGEVDLDALPTWQEIEQLIALVEDNQDRLFIHLAATTGMRTSELIALTHLDVELRNGKIKVRKPLVESNRGGQKLVATKNRRRRTVAFPPELRDALAERVAAAKADADGGGLGLLFPNSRGGSLSRTNFGKRVWRPLRAHLLATANLRFHELRHCAAVHMLYDLDLPVLSVSQILGHGDVGVTMRVYLNGRHDYADGSPRGWVGSPASSTSDDLSRV